LKQGRYNDTVEKRRMCPNCRAFISSSDRVCPYCDVQLGPRAIDQRPSTGSSSFLPHANVASMVVLSINCLFFLFEVLLSQHAGAPFGTVIPSVFIALGCKYVPLMEHGQWWRLITAGFLHGGFIHLAMNSYALIILVTEAEQFYGTARLIVAYLFSSVCGYILSSVMSPASPSLGASAAAFGLLGLMLAMAVGRRSDPIVQAVRAHYGRYLIFSLVLSVLPGIDIWAHIGGAIGGFAVGIVAGLPGLPSSPRERFWQVAAGLTLLIAAFAILKDFQFFRTIPL
jgi:rhomboid protease GluP